MYFILLCLFSNHLSQLTMWHIVLVRGFSSNLIELYFSSTWFQKGLFRICYHFQLLISPYFIFCLFSLLLFPLQERKMFILIDLASFNFPEINSLLEMYIKGKQKKTQETEVQMWSAYNCREARRMFVLQKFCVHHKCLSIFKATLL